MNGSGALFQTITLDYHNTYHNKYTLYLITTILVMEKNAAAKAHGKVLYAHSKKRKIIYLYARGAVVA